MYLLINFISQNGARKGRKGYAKETKRVRPSQHLRLLSGAYFGMIGAFYNDFITKPYRDFWIRKKIVTN